eukprot:6208017-Pleurochrysis_carterae.AAC.3
MVCIKQISLSTAVFSMVSKVLAIDAGDWRSFEATKRVVLNNVDPDCTFLSTSNSLFVNAPKQQLRTDVSSQISARLRNATMLLCLHATGTEEARTPTQGRIAVTTTANTVEYLTSRQPLKYSSMSRWSALTSKLEYGKKHGFPVFIAIGQLDPLQRKFRSPRQKSLHCRAPHIKLGQGDEMRMRHKIMSCNRKDRERKGDIVKQQETDREFLMGIHTWGANAPEREMGI